MHGQENDKGIDKIKKKTREREKKENDKDKFLSKLILLKKRKWVPDTLDLIWIRIFWS